MGSQTPGNEQFVDMGVRTTRGIPTGLRKYDLNDVIIYQSRRWAPLSWILRTTLPKYPATSMEPKRIFEDETPQTFTCSSDSKSGSYDEDILEFTNTNARHMVIGDRLICMDIFCDSDGANYSTTKFTSNYMPETMLIESIILDGIAANKAKIVVRRGNGYNPASSVTTVTTDYKFIRGGSAFPERWETPDSSNEEPGTIQTFLQIYSASASESEVRKNIDYFGKKSLEELTEDKRNQLMRRHEFDLIWGRQSRITVGGATRWTMGGIVPYIGSVTATTAKDLKNRLVDFGGAFDVGLFREKMEILSTYGSPDKLGLMGGAAFTVFFNYFENYLTVNDELTARWAGPGEGIVYDWDAGHVRLHIMRHPGFTDFSTATTAFDKDMLFVDLAYLRAQYLQNMDWTLRVGTQLPNTHDRMNEIFGVLGLQYAFPEAHMYIYGVTG